MSAIQLENTNVTSLTEMALEYATIFLKTKKKEKIKESYHIEILTRYSKNTSDQMFIQLSYFQTFI
jgi:hypothetical protein